MGVSTNVNNDKFRVRLTHRGKDISLGYYSSVSKAAKVYDDKCEELHGYRPNGTIKNDS